MDQSERTPPSSCRTCGVPTYPGATTCREHSQAAVGAAAPSSEPAGRWTVGPGTGAPPDRGARRPEPAPAGGADLRFRSRTDRIDELLPSPPAPAGKKKRSLAVRVLIGVVGFVVGSAVVGTLLGPDEQEQAMERVEDYVAGRSAEEFFSTEDQFRATFPAYPSREVTNEEVAGMDVTFRTYLSVQGDEEFAVGVYDYPPDTEFDLDAAVNGIAVGIDGRVESALPTTFAGFPAAEALLSAPDGIFVKVLLVRAPAHAYSVLVSGKQRPPAAYERFKASFRIG